VEREDLGEERLELLLRGTPCVVEALAEVRGARPVQHQARCPLRVCGGEQGGERHLMRESQDPRSLGTDRVEHGQHVVDAVLERRRAGDPVRQAEPSDVHQDEPGERGQALDPPADHGLSGPVVECGSGFVARDVQEVERRLADHFEGDVEVAVARIPDLGFHDGTSMA
jgi:hypothetical protein